MRPQSRCLLLSLLALNGAQLLVIALDTPKKPAQRPPARPPDVPDVPLLGGSGDGGTTGGAALSSSLWGRSGELFEPGFRLFDPSWAGFQGGAAIPGPGLSDHAGHRLLRVTDFGAKPNDDKSDSPALAAAVAAAGRNSSANPHEYTLILFPPGRFLLTTNITISSRVVLQGAGAGLTRLVFSKSMDDLHPKVWANHSEFSPWSFRNSLIEFRGDDSLYKPRDRLARITRATVPGSRLLHVDDTSRIRAGMNVRIVATDPPGSSGELVRYLFGDAGEGKIDLDISEQLAKINASNTEREDPVDPVRFVTAVAAVYPELGAVLLDRPLPYALQPQWSAAVMAFQPGLQTVGIQGFTLECPWQLYPGHFRESGHNPLAFVHVANCFARDLQILNADTAIAIEYAAFCSFVNISLGVTNGSRGPQPNLEAISGHHGISIGHSADVLMRNISVLTRFLHDVSWDWWTAHSVLSSSRGVDLNMDFHRSGAHGNLISDVTCGACTRPFESSGRIGRGLHAGMKNTFWRFRSDWRSNGTLRWPTGGVVPPEHDFGYKLNFVGTPLFEPGEAHPQSQDLRPSWLVEFAGREEGARLQPRDLYAAALQLRLTKRRAMGRPSGGALAPQQLYS